jgi:quinol-cytochrome oxidoreductase complex cytochrome b subunit
MAKSTSRRPATRKTSADVLQMFSIGAGIFATLAILASFWALYTGKYGLAGELMGSALGMLLAVFVAGTLRGLRRS